MTPALPPRPPEAADATLAASTSGAPRPDQDAARHQAAQELRLQHPRWVVLWISRTSRYHAYPLWTQRSVILTAEQPAELAAQMEHAEHAAPRSTPLPQPQQARPDH